MILELREQLARLINGGSATSGQSLQYNATSKRFEPVDDVITTKVTITSAELLALNTTPKVLVAAPGTGKAVVIEKVIATMDYNSAAYATNTDLEIRYDNAAAGDAGGSEVTMASLDAILLKTADEVAVVAGLGQADETSLTINK